MLVVFPLFRCSASVWLTHGLEVLPYLQHLQQSLLDLAKQQQETAEKKQQVISRLAQKKLQAKEVRKQQTLFLHFLLSFFTSLLQQQML